MKSNDIMLVESGGILFIGFVDVTEPVKIEDGPIMLGYSGVRLHKPRRVVLTAREDGSGEMQLLKCIGEPLTVDINNVDYSYYNEDKQLEKYYTANAVDIPGLKLAN